MTRMIGRLLVTLVLAAGVVFGLRATGVFAHAEYERSTPAKDEVVAAAPAQMDVYFSQEVFRQEGANFVRVFHEGVNDAGTQVSEGDGVIDDNDRTHITATLQAGLAEGRYIVRWQSLSDADGDDDEGAFCFYVVVQPTAEQAAECSAFSDEEEPTTAATSGGGETPGVTAGETAAVDATPTIAETVGDDDGSSNTGVIIGIIVAVVVVAVVGGGVALYMRQRQQG